MKVDILIQRDSTIYYPIVAEDVKLTWERKGTPGKLTFSVVKDDVIWTDAGFYTVDV